MIPAIAPPARIAPMRAEDIEQVRRLERALLAEPQVDLQYHHVLHAGMYARTVRIPAGVVITGALIKLATILVVNGDVSVFIGTETVRLQGYHVIPACAGRKQAFLAHTATDLTMVLSSRASTVEEAESEFTDEADLLQPRSSSFALAGD
ncbi:hypothetical protein ACKI2N_012410 [Cupriavidus sp. 30B13]|uniref:hypothetical protein n=1 Tax=Cupriavidus sp. 30B13 TaxID=3384241 RepID=UPI003B9043FB